MSGEWWNTPAKPAGDNPPAGKPAGEGAPAAKPATPPGKPAGAPTPAPKAPVAAPAPAAPKPPAAAPASATPKPPTTAFKAPPATPAPKAPSGAAASPHSAAPPPGANSPATPPSSPQAADAAPPLDATDPSIEDEEEEDEDEDDGLPYRRAGAHEKKLIATLSSALRVSRLHTLDNAVAVDALTDFLKALSVFLEKRDSVPILIGSDRISVAGAVVKLRRGSNWQRDFTEFLARMGVGALVFRGQWTLESIRAFVDAFARKLPIGLEERLKAISEVVALIPPPARAEVLGVAEAAKVQEVLPEVELNDAETAAFDYARLVALGEAAEAAALAGQSPDLHVRHLRQTLVRIVGGMKSGLYELRIVGLTALPLPAQGLLASHAANVTVLSLAMGRLLGLRRGPLANLGFAAFFHDLGRAGGAPRRAAADGTSEDRASRDAHVIRGVSRVLKSRGYSDAGLLRLVVAQEHHRAVDRLPEGVESGAPYAASRLVGVADAFDKLEHGTPWQPPQGPARALKALEADKARHEPEVVRLLRDVLGERPRGSLLRLKDRSVAVIVDGGARRGRAVARRVLGPDGRPAERGALFELDPATIDKSLTPAEVTADWGKVLTS